MNKPRVELAALNNALWCNAVCRAHGVPGEVRPTLWRNERIPPPYHSNVVVIAGDVSQAEIDEQVRELSVRNLSPTWSVKDSFASLDLVRHGFSVLFQATWIWLESTVATPIEASPTRRCIRICSPSELARWESAWRGDSRNESAPQETRQFPDILLLDLRHAFLAFVDGQEIVAGAIANRTPGVTGLSNVFVNAGDRNIAWAALARFAIEVFPGFPVVGYERDDDLLVAESIGFQSIGQLRVWIRQQ